MNKNNNLPKDLPPGTNEFQIDVKGNLTGKRYIGEFTCRLPDVKTQCQISKHQAALDGEYAKFLDAGTRNVHKMIAYLRYTLLEPYPKFWLKSDLGYELYDMNVIKEVYDKVLEFEENWVKEVWGEEDEDIEEEKDKKSKSKKSNKKEENDGEKE